MCDFKRLAHSGKWSSSWPRLLGCLEGWSTHINRLRDKGLAEKLLFRFQSSVGLVITQPVLYLWGWTIGTSWLLSLLFEPFLVLTEEA